MLSLLALATIGATQEPAAAPSSLADCDVLWTSPSESSSGAMPIGNGELGAMVWFGPDGVLHLLLSRTDSFSEASRLLKLGEVRVRLGGAPGSRPFAQRLHLACGTIAIDCSAGDAAAHIVVFVDSDTDVIHVEGETASGGDIAIECDSCRRQAHRLRGEELRSSWTMKDAPDDVVVSESADVSVPADDGAPICGWRHHNATSVVPFTAARQGLDVAVVPDVLLHRTFGFVASCPGATREPAAADAVPTLHAKGTFSLRIAAPCAITMAPERWDARARALLAGADPSAARARTAAWWRAFWQRSWVLPEAGGPALCAAGKASRLAEALTLQRWLQACGGRGTFPIKFNGSIFTVEPKATGGQTFDADWRRWGDCFWWQNTRLPYYPMLAQGDFDMQAPLFRLYRDTLPVALLRVRSWNGGDVRGGYWPETMTPFGTHANGDYGWQRDGVPVGKVLCPWWELARNQGLELLALMLDRYDYEQQPRFVQRELLPIAVPVLQWFATAYARGDDGVLRIEPTQSLETYWTGVRDDMPTVAGLRCVLPRLLALPAELLDGAPADDWRALLRALPPLPIEVRDGIRMLAPAAAYDEKRSNCESPELYAVFPFRLFSLDRPDLALAREAYVHRHDRFTKGWPQDGQVAALLGFADDCRQNVLARLQNHNAAHRFPVMWGPNFDWLPDQCHGANLLDAVHRMLMQCDGTRIRLLPAWPRDWDVAFKLHAPGCTTVECDYRGGKVERLVVTPSARERDVAMPDDAPR